jgi:hypothetical protein
MIFDSELSLYVGLELKKMLQFVSINETLSFMKRLALKQKYAIKVDKRSK